MYLPCFKTCSVIFIILYFTASHNYLICAKKAEPILYIKPRIAAYGLLFQSWILTTAAIYQTILVWFMLVIIDSFIFFSVDMLEVANHNHFALFLNRLWKRPTWMLSLFLEKLLHPVNLLILAVKIPLKRYMD